MSEENEAVEIDETITSEVQEVEDSAQDEQPEQQAETEQPEQTELTASALKAVNKKHFQFKEQERRADALQQQLDQLNASQQPEDIVIPEVPDAFDENVDELTAARDAAITKRAQQQAQNSVLQAQQLQYDQQLQAQQQQVLAEKSTAYAAKAKDLGVNQEELQQAGNTIAQYISMDVAHVILDDPEGPLISKYLASNPVELDNLSRMAPVQAALHIERTIKTKAQALKPKKSSTPTPPSDIVGSGQDPDIGKYPHSKGAKIW